MSRLSIGDSFGVGDGGLCLLLSALGLRQSWPLQAVCRIPWFPWAHTCTITHLKEFSRRKMRNFYFSEGSVCQAAIQSCRQTLVQRQACDKKHKIGNWLSHEETGNRLSHGADGLLMGDFKQTIVHGSPIARCCFGGNCWDFQPGVLDLIILNFKKSVLDFRRN